MFKFIWGKKFLFLGIIVVVGLIAYSVMSNDRGEVNYDFAEASYVDITQDVSVTGTVETDSKINLRFQAVGQVDTVYVEVGDIVSAGTSLARLDATSLAIKVDAAEADLALAQANYDQAVAGSTDEAVLVAEASVAKAQADLNKAESDLESIRILSEDAVASAELGYQSALTDYDNAVATYGEDIEHVYEDAYNVLGSVFNEVNDSLRNVDNILGVDNETINDDFELAFNATDKNIYKGLQNDYEDISDLYDELFIELVDDHDSVDSLLVECAQLLDDMDDLLDGVDDFLVDSQIIGGYTTSVREAKRAIIATEIGNISTITTSFDNANQAVESSVTDEVASLATYEDALDVADLASDIAIAQAVADVAGAEVSVNVYEALLAQAEANLASVEIGPRDVDLASLEASIDSAEASLALAQYNLSESYIVAPVSGVITEIYFDAGENITSSEDFLVMLSDDYQIIANVSETDISKIKIGDKVMMTLDAFSYDKEFEAEIVEIDPAETVVQGVIYYQITAVFTVTDTDIKPGMTANMDIVTAEVMDVLAVPLRAIKYDGSRTYVFMIDEMEEVYEVDVKTGVEGSQYVEILSGLEEGDSVVTYVR